MTAVELFTALAPHAADVIEGHFGNHYCILTTRVVIDVARYYGVNAKPMPVRMLIYNAAFATHIENGDTLGVDCYHWAPIDGSYSLGVGFGDRKITNKWNGHLITVADGCFGDFSIRQTERIQHGIVTGGAVTGRLPANAEPLHWTVFNTHGTTIEYERMEDSRWQLAPDWRDEKRRRPLVGEIIRRIEAVK